MIFFASDAHDYKNFLEEKLILIFLLTLFSMKQTFVG